MMSPSSRTLSSILLGVALALGRCVAGLAAESATATSSTVAPAGVTMRIAQEISLGDLSCTTEYRACFLPPDRFRVDGTMRLKTMEMDIKMVVVGNGPLVKQLSETPMGPQAMILDLDRVRKAIPEYAPSKTYDPAVYRELLDKTQDKKSLPDDTLDG